MIRLTPTLLAPLAIALVLTLPALAEGCTPTTSDPEFELAGVYVDDDCAGVDPSPPNDHCITPLGGKWIYLESNGIPGLQRRDVHDDTCGGEIPSDTLIF